MSTAPTALREPQPRRSFAWLLPVIALIISVFLLSQGLGGRGPLVQVQAVNGHGIRVGDVEAAPGVGAPDSESDHPAHAPGLQQGRQRLQVTVDGTARHFEPRGQLAGRHLAA